MFSISISAHEQTNTFQSQFNTSLVTPSATTSMYTMNNGGFIQLIYKVFNKVGHVLYTTINTNEVPNEEETTNENN